MGSLLKSVKILLDSKCRIIAPVIPALGVHIIDQSDGQKFQIRYRKPKLYAPEQE